MHRIAHLLPDPVKESSLARTRLMALWEEYEARETVDAIFVKDLDMFELGLQAVEYERCESLHLHAPSVSADGVVSERYRRVTELLPDDDSENQASRRQEVGDAAVRLSPLSLLLSC